MSFNIGKPNPSKGKWIPGTKDVVNKCSIHYCEVCERDFVNLTGLQKHMASELHFKRSAMKEGKILQKCNDLYEEIVPQHIIRDRRKKLKPSNAEGMTSNDETNAMQVLQCPSCYSTVDKLRMGKHLISHFHCQKVNGKDRQSDSENKLILEHIHQIVVQSPFQCSQCKYYFTQREQLLEHFEKHHVSQTVALERNGLDGWNCSSCPDVLANSGQEMLQHLTSQQHCKMEVAISKSIPIIVRKISLRTCSICSKSFALHRELASHLKNVHPTNVTTTSSTSIITTKGGPEMKKEASATSEQETSSDLAKVMECDNVDLLSPTQSKIKSFICSVCAATFGSNASLNRHKAQSHPRKSQYECELCDYKTKTSSHFLRHSKQHTQDREKTFCCDICGKAFFEKYALNHHKKLHTGKDVACTFTGCQFLGSSQSEVTAHFQRHIAERKFQCDQCDYCGKTKFSLTRHTKLIHNGSEKKYSCKMCSYTSSLYNGLKRHEMTQHNIENLYCCPHCNFTCKALEKVRIHVVKRNIHAGLLLYNCNECKRNKDSAYGTNKFSDFKTHTAKCHFQSPGVKTDLELLVLAGIRKTDQAQNETEVEKTTKEYDVIMDCQNQDEINNARIATEKDSTISPADDLYNHPVSQHLDDDFSTDYPTSDIYVDELYDELLVVSSEELESY